MRVLLLGSGGREHALSWKIAQSTQLEQLFIAPGNAGTAQCGTNVVLNILDFKAVCEFVRQHRITTVVVGPEEPLVKGIHDFISAQPDLQHVLVVGPKQRAAMLEGSKNFAKAFMERHQVPTAAYRSFTVQDIRAGQAFLETLKPPFVLKADGLAAGKGVLILDNLAEAQRSLADMLRGSFGEASKTVVVEEFLKGIELSVFVVTDGLSYKLLPAAKDYKRVGEGDTGLNTGGMGAVSPVPFLREDILQKIEDSIVKPVIRGLRKDNIPYQGFLFIGLMLVRNEPYVIEFNVRMGDPETQVVMSRLKSDLLDLFEGIQTGTLSERHIEIDERTASTIVLCSGGYPGNYAKGKAIAGLDEVTGSEVFHSGTAQDENGRIVTAGGRILCVTTLAKNLERSLEVGYRNAQRIEIEGAFYRRDIGADLMVKETR